MQLRTNTSGYHKAAIELVVALGFVALPSLNAVTLNLTGADTTANGWRTINSASGGYMTDATNDSQTGQAVCEIVGTTASPAAYLGYGTVSSTSYIGFRVRFQSLSSTENNLKQCTWFGFNFDGDASVDMWVGMDHQDQNSSKWQIVIANATSQNDNTQNIGPSNASMVYSTGGQTTLPINGYTPSLNTNYAYTTVTATNTTIGSSLDLDGGGASDAILSWLVPFADFSAAINSSSVMGTSFGYNENTLFTVTVVTSNTQNTVNQDVLGLSGLTGSFVYSEPISAATPVPEPHTAMILGALFAPFALRRRRRA